MVEVEEVSGAPEVSVPGWPKVATPHARGVGPWHPLAWLRPLCCFFTWPGVMGSFPAHHCSLLSWISRPVAGLGPGELRRNCVALSWLWVSDGWTVHWIVRWHGYCCWLMS